MRNNTSGNSDFHDLKIEETDAINTSSQTIAVLEYSPEKVIDKMYIKSTLPHITKKVASAIYTRNEHF